MSNKPLNPGPDAMTRRRVLRHLALGSLVASTSCQEECLKIAKEFPVFRLLVVALSGQRESEIVQEYHRIQERVNSGELPPIPDFFGIVRDSAAGPAPESGSGAGLSAELSAPQRRQQANRRAHYILDTLGDDRVDGRVYAIDLTENAATLRGEVGLRAADSSAPFIELRHIALSADGATIIVSQQGAPSQWIFIDAAALTISGRLMAQAGESARRAVFSPDGKLAYLVAGTNSSNLPPATLHIADVAARRIVGRVELPQGTTVADLDVTPDGSLLIAGASQFLHVIDLRTGTYGGRVIVARALSDPQGAIVGRFQRILMDPSGALFYAGPIHYPSEERYSVGTFDVRTIGQIGDMTVQDSPSVGNTLMGLSRTGDTVLYAAQLGTAVQLFETATGKELLKIPIEASYRLSTLAVA